MSSPKTGLLIINLGTPKSTELKDVKDFLKNFLMDPNVIDLPKPLRALLVYGIILPLRAKKVRPNYQKIWLTKGSPLLVYSNSFAHKLSDRLPDYQIELCMRYGEPSIQQAFENFKQAGISNIKVFQMFPHASIATTQTNRDAIVNTAMKMGGFEIEFVKEYFNHPYYIEALYQLVKDLTPEHWVFSYHGLPEDFIPRQSQWAGCLKVGCCEQFSKNNQNCYRAQCFETSRQLAKRLGLTSNQYITSFQSRLGRKKWIGPYTDETIHKLAQTGKSVAVVSPSFLCDCIETLEELNIQERASFESQSQADFFVSPCLNDANYWVEYAAKLIQQY